MLKIFTAKNVAKEKEQIVEVKPQRLPEEKHSTVEAMTVRLMLKTVTSKSDTPVYYTKEQLNSLKEELGFGPTVEYRLCTIDEEGRIQKDLGVERTLEFLRNESVTDTQYFPKSTSSSENTSRPELPPTTEADVAMKAKEELIVGLCRACGIIDPEQEQAYQQYSTTRNLLNAAVGIKAEGEPEYDLKYLVEQLANRLLAPQVQALEDSTPAPSPVGDTGSSNDDSNSPGTSDSSEPSKPSKPTGGSGASGTQDSSADPSDSNLKILRKRLKRKFGIQVDKNGKVDLEALCARFDNHSNSAKSLELFKLLSEYKSADNQPQPGTPQPQPQPGTPQTQASDSN